MMSMGGDVAVTASMHNGTAWQPLPQLLFPNASVVLISSAIKFRASVPDCNRALATLEYRSAAPVSPSVDEIARITVIVNDMGNYGCYNDCSTAESVPLLAVCTIVIVNYGGFSHKGLLLRPGVLLGVATGVGMLLIVIASVCAWLYLVNRLLSAQGKGEKNQLKHSLTSLKTRWNFLLAKFSKAEDSGPQEPTISSSGVADGVLLEDEGQQAYIATETADDGYTQDEAQGNSVMYDKIDTYAKDQVPEDVIAADLHVDCFTKDVSAVSGASCVISGDGSASCVISGDGIHNCAQFDAARAANEAFDVISRDGIHDHAQSDYPASIFRQCPRFSHDKSPPSEAIHDPDLAGYVQSTDSLVEKNCPAGDTMEAMYDPFSGSDFQSSDTCGGDFQITKKVDTVDHDVDGYSLPGNIKADGHTLPGNQFNYKGVLINDFLGSMPFGDSSSSSQSCTSTEEGNANLERTMSIEPMIGTHGELEEDMICALHTNTSNPSITSHPAELIEDEMSFDDKMSQMPALKLVLEIPEASSLDDDMDILDHINLVFSSLETDADGSLVAVLSQSV